MSITNTINKTVSVDGKSYTQQKNVTSNSSQRREIALAPAKTGTLTTRTDNDTGELTMTAGHGITTGAKVDVYWTISGVTFCRRYMTVGTVATNQVPIDAGSGDVLPSTSQACTVMVHSVNEFRFDGDDAKVIVVTANAPAVVILTGDDDVEDYAFVITENGQVKEWYFGSGEANPVAADVITKARVTHGDSTGTKTIKVTVAND